MPAGFDMYVHDSGAAIADTADVLLRLDNHQMHVEREAGELAHGFNHRESERDVRHEHAIHHVAVQPGGAGSFDSFNLACEMAEIGGE